MENRDWYQGTADAVRQNLCFFESLGRPRPDPLGRPSLPDGLPEVRRVPQRTGADISISVMPVPADQVREFGRDEARRRPAGSSSSRKNPRRPRSSRPCASREEFFAARGVESRRPDPPRLDGDLRLQHGPSSASVLMSNAHEDFGKQIIPMAIRQKKVFGYFFDGYWEDIGTIPSFFEANLNLTEPLPRFNFYDEERPIFTHARFLPGSKILASNVHELHPLRGEHHQRVRTSASRSSASGRGSARVLPDRTDGRSWAPIISNRGRRSPGTPRPGSPPIGIGRGLRDPQRHHRQERPDRRRRPAGQRRRASATGNDGRRLHRRRDHRRPQERRRPRRNGRLERLNFSPGSAVN